MYDTPYADQLSAQQELITTASNQQQEQINQMIATFQEQLGAYIPYLVAVSLLVSLFLIINMVQKFRSEKAILRIDKNLEKLVNRMEMLDAMSPAKQSVSESSDPLSTRPSHTEDTQKDTSDNRAKKGWYE